MGGMKRVALLLMVVAGAACSKPTADDCRKAITNLQRIQGLDQSSNLRGQDIEAYVRKCRATGDPQTVKCFIDAKTDADIARCEPAVTPAK